MDDLPSPGSDPAPSGSWVRRRMPHEALSVREARHALRAELDRAGIGGRLASEAELILAELIANAVQHGEPDADGLVLVSWNVSPDRVLLSVRDSGHAPDLRPADLDADGTSGRGLALVDLLCSRWCWNTDQGTQVGAELLPR
jgi:serine/threonine-protein kinase RsbW